MYVNKKVSNLNLCTDLSSVLLVPYLQTANYPINLLRNLVVKKVRTRFMFLIDADFQASPNLETIFDDFLHKHYASELVKKSEQSNLCSLAFVVPAFEYFESPKVSLLQSIFLYWFVLIVQQADDPIMKSKDELIQLIHREDPMIQPFSEFFNFHVQIFWLENLFQDWLNHRMLIVPLTIGNGTPPANRTTSHWPFTTNTNHTLLSSKFVFVCTAIQDNVLSFRNCKTLPLYNDKLTNYGMNKVMHITELFAAGYQFQVIPNVWTIHFPHIPTTFYLNFLQNLEHRLRNRAQRFSVLQEIIWKYSIGLAECKQGFIGNQLE